MKKTYQKPEILIAHLTTQGIIAASPNGTDVYGSSADSNKPTLSRRRGRRNQWDDEDYEEEEW